MGALIVMVLSGARGLTQEDEKEIRTQSIYILDDQGNRRAMLDSGGLMFINERGRMSASFSDFGVSVEDPSSKKRVSLSDFGLLIHDENRKSRVFLDEHGLNIHDEEENTVLTAGYSPWQGTGVLEITGGDGALVWEAPGSE
jgi:hypothetical protein